MAETPAWVPLVGYALSGGLGIIGTLAGQWATGKRSDKERIRGDERAGQERRRVVYEDFLSAVWEAYDSILLALVVVRNRVPAVPGNEVLQGLTKSLGRVGGLLARVQLVGSAKASQAATDVELFMIKESVGCLTSESDDSFNLGRLHGLVDAFIWAARADIGAHGLSVAPTRVNRGVPDQPVPDEG